MPKAIKAYAAVLAAVFFWGLSFVATKTALEGFSPYTLLFSRFALAAGLLLPFWFVRGRERLHSQDLLLFFLVGIMEPGLYFIFETQGLLRTTASAASLIVATIPVFVCLLAAILFGEALTARVIVGVLLTIIGVAGLTGHDLLAEGLVDASFEGNMLVLLGALCASCYIIVSRGLRSRYGALTVTTVQVVFAALFFLPFAALEWARGMVPQFTGETTAAMLFLAFFATVFAFLFYNFSLGGMQASRAAVFINLIPVVTVLAAWIYLGEMISWSQGAGGALILLGVFATTRGGLETTPSKSTFVGPFSFLNGRYHERGLSLVTAQQHVESAPPPVVGAGRGKGQHEPL